MVPRCLSRTIPGFLAVFSLVALLGFAPDLDAQCEVPDNGTGTIDLPPPGCGYVSPGDLHLMIAGLPAGATINVAVEHAEFFNVQTMPGGTLGGEIEVFDSILQLTLTGTGALNGFVRNIGMQVNCEVHTGPRTPGDPVQAFPTDMFRIEGAIFGDPDFDTLEILAGTAFGLPSPGFTTLTQLPNGNFNVDSFFDIDYQITFQGAPGSILDGFAGTTSDNVPMQAGGPPLPDCTVPDNGTGTVDLPPQGCGYVSPEDLHIMIEGLPPGTFISVAVDHQKFFNVQTQPGGPLGGELEFFDSILIMDMSGTGALQGFQRTIFLQVNCLVATGPRVPGDPIQDFPNEMLQLEGSLFGDPDFDFLTIRAGANFGLPSPGNTTLTQLPTGDFNVDSFFDIAYEIEFQGAPGSILEGFGGITQENVVMATGNDDNVPQPPADPEPCNLTQDFMTQSVDESVVPLNSVSCNAGGITSDNRYLRHFDMAAEGLLGQDLQIVAVEIGVEVSSPGPGFTDQPLTVEIYGDDDNSPAPYADMNLLGSIDTTFPLFGNPGLQCIDFQGTPVDFDGTEASFLACAISVPDATAGTGSGENHVFFIGSNPNGQTGPSFISSDGCSLTEPTDLAAIGFPGMHIVMNVYYVPLAPPAPNFIRGDADRDGVYNPLADALFILTFGFLGGPPPTCDDSADADDDGTLNPLADALWVLTHGFLGGPPPPMPFPGCGPDPTADALGCASHPCP